MSQLIAPVLPDHVKKPNEEEYKKTLEQINGNIEKIQKQFVSFALPPPFFFTLLLLNFHHRHHHHTHHHLYF